MSSTPATGRDLHVDMPLSNVIVNRRPEGFIADQLLPITNVSKRSDTYYKFYHGLNSRYTDGLDRRAPGTEARKVGYQVSSDTYYCENYALGAEMPVEDMVNADAELDWYQSNVNHVADRLMTAYEARVATLCANSANTTQVSTVATAWSISSANIFNDLVSHIETFRLRTGLKPNTLIMPYQVAAKIRSNVQVRDLLFGDRGGLVTPENLASLFGLDKVVMPSALYNTATDEATLAGSWSYSDIWGTDVWLARVNLLAGKETDTWINAFRWTSPMFNTPFAVQRYGFDEKRKVQGFEISYYQDEKVVSPDLATRIINVVST